MTETEFRSIEKKMIEKIKGEEVGSQTHKIALAELEEFQKTYEETRKNKENESVEKQRIESQETVAKCQRDLEEQKLEFEREKLKQEKEIEERRLKAEKLTRMWNFIGTIVSVFGGLAGTIGGIVIGNKMFDKQATKAYKFEETGTISSFTSKQIMSGLKPPKR